MYKFSINNFYYIKKQETQTKHLKFIYFFFGKIKIFTLLLHYTKNTKFIKSVYGKDVI